MDRNLQLLGIAKKAGCLAIGGEAASSAARSGRARAIISAGDASDGARRRAQRDAAFCGASYILTPYTMREIGRITGRGSPGTVAFLDSGLAEGFLRGLTAAGDPERNAAAADQERNTAAGDPERNAAADPERNTAAGEPKRNTKAGRGVTPGQQERQTGPEAPPEPGAAAEPPIRPGGGATPAFSKDKTTGKRRTAQ